MTSYRVHGGGPRRSRSTTPRWRCDRTAGRGWRRRRPGRYPDALLSAPRTWPAGDGAFADPRGRVGRGESERSADPPPEPSAGARPPGIVARSTLGPDRSPNKGRTPGGTRTTRRRQSERTARPRRPRSGPSRCRDAMLLRDHGRVITEGREVDSPRPSSFSAARRSSPAPAGSAHFRARRSENRALK